MGSSQGNTERSHGGRSLSYGTHHVAPLVSKYTLL